jgi:hypothetical protein
LRKSPKGVFIKIKLEVIGKLKVYDGELHSLRTLYNVIGAVKSRRMPWPNMEARGENNKGMLFSLSVTWKEATEYLGMNGGYEKYCSL